VLRKVRRVVGGEEPSELVSACGSCAACGKAWEGRIVSGVESVACPTVGCEERIEVKP